MEIIDKRSQKKKFKMGKKTKIFVIVFAVLFVIAGLVYALATITITGGVSSLEKGLVGHWILDSEGYNPATERITDKTPYENHGTNYGAVLTTDQMGQSDRAMYFDGGSDYVNCGNDESLDITEAITIVAWVKVREYGWPNNIVHKYISSAWGSWYLSLSVNSPHNKLRFCFIDEEGGYQSRESDITIPLDEWTHVVVTHNGTTKLYVNGMEAGERYVGKPMMSAPGQDLEISQSTSTFNGTISDVRIYNRALSADEIDTLYQTYRRKASAGPLQKGIVGHWALDAESYNSNTARVTDKTPYENHGTNYGATFTTDQMGQSNRAMSFDGEDDYVEVLPVPSDVGAFGVALWINTTRQSDYTYYIHRGETANLGGSIFCIGQDSANRLMWAVNGRYVPGASSTLVPENVWIHLVGTYDGNNARLYLNGDLIHTDTFGAITSDPTGNKMGIGGTAWPIATRFTDGSISDARIYNHELSAEEIDTLYHSYRPKASSGSLLKGLVFDMPLKFKYTKDETVGSEVLTDRTPYSNDGQNYGASVGSDYTSFDGENDYVMLTSAMTFGDELTIGMWFNKFDSGVMLRTLIAKNAAGQQKIFFDGTNRLGVRIVSGIVYKDIGYTADMDGSWHHLMVTRDASNVVKVYLDADTPIIFMTEAGDSIWQLIGKSLDANQIWKGSISNTRIYNRALSESEIKLLFDKGR